MIAKNIKGKSFRGCVSYVMHEGAELLETEGVLALSKEDIIQSFGRQRSGRREIKQPVGHIPLSFAPEDRERMTNDFMVQLAKEYMEEMGIKNTQYIIVRHHNTDNEHVHIIYNRIDNDLKLISVNHDFKRNIKVCKKLKDKHGLTYGKGKERVKREKLKNPDAVKYLLHDIIKAILPYCTSEKEFQEYLQSKGIDVEFKQKRTTVEIEGISFNYNNVSFKGSEVDRKFSFGNLKKEFEKNLQESLRQKLQEQQREQERIRAQEQDRKKQEQEQQRKQQEQKRRWQEEHLRELAKEKAKRESEAKAKQEAEEKAKQEAQKQEKVILGVKLTPEQERTIMSGGYVYLENMVHPNDKTKFSAYAFANDDKDSVSFSRENPDRFVKYGRYEMRIRDKILIERGAITKATVKWWGDGQYAHPYLWKENKSDAGYKESWSDPRLPKPEKSEQKPRVPVIQKKKRGRSM